MCKHMYIFGYDRICNKCCAIKREERGGNGHFLCIFDDHYISSVSCPLGMSGDSRRYI